MKTQGKYGVAATVAGAALCEDVRNFSSRRRNLLYLMHQYLQDNGFYSSADALKSEAHVTEEYELCDNIDLDSIYLEYASFFNLKFGKYPRILKKAAPKLKLELSNHSKNNQSKQKLPTATVQPTQEQRAGEAIANWHMGVGVANAALANVAAAASKSTTVESTPELQLHVKKLDTAESLEQRQLNEIEHRHGVDDALFSSLEWQALGELVKNTILREDIKLRWLDVCGNQHAIELIKEAVVTPIEFPQLFQHGLRPWRSLLLHGPPGSGKTFLAKALYAETQHQVCFFNITASLMVSKWRGESEKILRVLFHMAARRAPSIIFFDEIESLTSKRDRSTDHESSKRFKNELLQLLDGMEHNLSGVFVLASTNLPWDIDEAFLRRFEKKLLIQLPNASERSSLIRRLLGNSTSLSLTPHVLERLVQLSEHFTGDEIRLACKEISMQSVRRVTKPNARESQSLQENLESAFKQVRAVGHKLLAKHEQWQQENGS